jgi:hypothetical protein
VDLRRTTEEGELVDRSDAEKDRRHEYRVAAAALDLLAADLERAFGLDEVAPEAAVPSVDDPSLLDDAAGYILDQLSPEGFRVLQSGGGLRASVYSGSNVRGHR